MAYKKICGQIHHWLGLSSGLVVVLLGFTGCIFCWQKELKEVFYSNRIFINSAMGSNPVSLDVLKESAQDALGENYPIRYIEYWPNSNKTILFRASKYNEDAITYNGEIVYNKTVFVNPFSGKVQAIEDSKWEFFNVVLQLHYNLLLNNIGHYIIGWSTVIFLVMLITGLVLWWPQKKEVIKQRLMFDWNKNTKWKRKNYDLHNVVGFYSLLISFCIALTGLWFAFSWFREPVKWIINGGKEMSIAKPVFSDTLNCPLQNVLYKTMSYVEKEPVKGQFYFISLPDKKNAPIAVTAMLNKHNYAKRSQYLFDRSSGNLLKKQTNEMKSSAEKFIGMIYDIHVGKVLGFPGQILAFLASLIAASLPISGYFIFLGRNKKRRA